MQPASPSSIALPIDGEDTYNMIMITVYTVTGVVAVSTIGHE